MRLKKLLGVPFLLLILSTMAVAAVTQLTKISVAGKDHATTVILHANGAFTHTEYRPVDNLLLVDMAGVVPGRLKDSTRAINRPGVVSYRVLGYTGANGNQVTRLELSLASEAVVNVSEAPGVLQVQVSSTAKPAAAPPAPVVAKSENAPAQAGKPVKVERLSVVRGKNSIEVEIASSRPLTPKVMKLTSPDRVVLDLPNAVPAAQVRPILVNGADIKSVRLARYQVNPPVTRVVVDLVAPREYELLPSANKLVLRLRSAESHALAPAAADPRPTVTPAVAAPADKPKLKQAVAREFVVVEPAYTTKPAEPEPNPKAQAQAAAQVMAASETRKDTLLPAPSATLGAPAKNLALEQQQQQTQRAAQPPAAGPRYTGEPISVNLKDVDLKDFFRLIHEISGLNIVLDPAVRGSLTLVLDDVPWDQALDIVLQNNGLDRRLEGNVLRIATRDTFTKEADARRAQEEAQALAVPKVQVTHFLSYAHATDVLPIIKKFLSQRGDVVADPRTNALIITDIPSVLPEVQRVLTQLDRKTQEVEIEARVVAATRNFSRDIGVQLGFGWGNNVTGVSGAPAVAAAGSGLTSTSKAAPIFPTLGGAVPLFSNLAAVGPTSGIAVSNATRDYRIDAILTMAETRGLLKILSRPRVVTQNNIGATVKQGVRIPVVTAAQLGGPPTTTYIEAALRLQVTPQITVENTIFLNVDVENTTPDFAHAVAGNPSLLTQQATTQVLVTDGGTVVIGGVIQTNNSVTVDQVPLLGDIPILGNLFKRRAVSTSTQELIFFITPKIVQT